MRINAAGLTFLRQQYEGKRISFVSGNFRIIHAGHVRLLRFAREMADVLIVGVLPKNSGNARFNEEERLDNVRALSVVDHVFLMRSLPDALRFLRPDFVIKGTEHQYKPNTEAKILEEYGGKLIFAAGTVAPSAADIMAITDARTVPIQQPMSFLTRHDISGDRLRNLCAKMREKKVTVIGDVIVDAYINCSPLGMSQEDPTIVVAPEERTSYLGGAGIVAAHAAGLGASVEFVTVCGQDDTARFVQEKIDEYKFTAHIFSDDTRPTTLKERFRCKNKTLLRVSHLRQHGIDKKLCDAMLRRVQEILSDTDVLIFSDFNYGCLPQYLVDNLTRLAHDRGILIAADSQSSSQVGDVSRFPYATLLTPTEREARLAVHDFESGLVVLAGKLLKKSRARHVCLTLGEAGVLVQPDAGAGTEQIPALNTAPLDVAGAGDSLLVCASLALATGGDIWQASYLGSLAAAIQINRQGNIPLCMMDIESCLAALPN